MEKRHEVSAILANPNLTPSEVAERLFPLVYDELRSIAARYFGHERRDHTLQPTALVHEAYLRLVDQHSVHWQSRAHFLAVAATMMRRVLLDYARSHLAARHGGQAYKVELDESSLVAARPLTDYLVLEQALRRLEELDARQAHIVELRFFGGMTLEEVADHQNLSTATVKRYWNSAKAFLQRELSQEKPIDPGAMEPGSGAI